jgi:hypothetical protein
LQLPPYSLDLLRAVATFWTIFGAGNGMKDARFFLSFHANGKGVARHVLLGFFNSNAGFVGILVAAFFFQCHTSPSDVFLFQILTMFGISRTPFASLM